MPIEPIIHERQIGYYKAINASNTAGESTIFVEFMLELIRDLIKEDGNISAAKMALRLGLSQRQIQRSIKKLRDEGIIEHAGANRNGFYRIVN